MGAGVEGGHAHAPGRADGLLSASPARACASAAASLGGLSRSECTGTAAGVGWEPAAIVTAMREQVAEELDGVGRRGRSRGAGLAAPSMLWRCGWPAARARRQLRTVEPVKAPLQRRSRLARGQEGAMRTPRAGPMGCCCRYTPALSTRATNVASSGGSSGSECAGCGRGVGCGRAKSGERPHSADLGGAAPMMPSEAEPMPVRANNWARDTPFPAGTRAESAAFCPLLFSAATSIGKQESLSSDSLVGDGTVVGFGGVHRRLGAARA